MAWFEPCGKTQEHRSHHWRALVPQKPLILEEYAASYLYPIGPLETVLYFCGGVSDYHAVRKEE